MREFRFLDEKRKQGGLAYEEEQRWLELCQLLGVAPEAPAYETPDPNAGYYAEDGNWYPYAQPGYPPSGELPPAEQPQGYWASDGNWYPYAPQAPLPSDYPAQGYAPAPAQVDAYGYPIAASPEAAGGWSGDAPVGAGMEAQYGSAYPVAPEPYPAASYAPPMAGYPGAGETGYPAESETGGWQAQPLGQPVSGAEQGVAAYPAYETMPPAPAAVDDGGPTEVDAEDVMSIEPAGEGTVGGEVAATPARDRLELSAISPLLPQPQAAPETAPVPAETAAPQASSWDTRNIPGAAAEASRGDEVLSADDAVIESTTAVEEHPPAATAPFGTPGDAPASEPPYQDTGAEPVAPVAWAQAPTPPPEASDSSTPEAAPPLQQLEEVPMAAAAGSEPAMEPAEPAGFAPEQVPVPAPAVEVAFSAPVEVPAEVPTQAGPFEATSAGAEVALDAAATDSPAPPALEPAVSEVDHEKTPVPGEAPMAAASAPVEAFRNPFDVAPAPVKGRRPLDAPNPFDAPPPPPAEELPSEEAVLAAAMELSARRATVEATPAEALVEQAAPNGSDAGFGAPAPASFSAPTEALPQELPPEQASPPIDTFSAEPAPIEPAPPTFSSGGEAAPDAAAQFAPGPEQPEAAFAAPPEAAFAAPPEAAFAAPPEAAFAAPPEAAFAAPPEAAFAAPPEAPIAGAAGSDASWDTQAAAAPGRADFFVAEAIAQPPDSASAVPVPEPVPEPYVPGFQPGAEPMAVESASFAEADQGMPAAESVALGAEPAVSEQPLHGGLFATADVPPTDALAPEQAVPSMEAAVDIPVTEMAYDSSGSFAATEAPVAEAPNSYVPMPPEAAPTSFETAAERPPETEAVASDVSLSDGDEEDQLVIDLSVADAVAPIEAEVDLSDGEESAPPPPPPPSETYVPEAPVDAAPPQAMATEAAYTAPSEAPLGAPAAITQEAPAFAVPFETPFPATPAANEETFEIDTEFPSESRPGDAVTAVAHVADIRGRRDETTQVVQIPKWPDAPPQSGSAAPANGRSAPAEVDVEVNEPDLRDEGDIRADPTEITQRVAIAAIPQPPPKEAPPVFGSAAPPPVVKIRPSSSVYSPVHSEATPITKVSAPPPAPPAAAPAVAAAPTGPSTFVTGEHRVIVHTMEGQVKRGLVRDLNLLSGNVTLEQQAPVGTEDIPTSRVKAIFFMQTPGSAPPASSGQKIRVTFFDGRQVAGFSDDFNGSSNGFFLIPADARTNTARIYIYRKSVQSVAEG